MASCLNTFAAVGRAARLTTELRTIGVAQIPPLFRPISTSVSKRAAMGAEHGGFVKRSNSYYRQIVDRIETIACTDVGEPLRVADLCRVACVSERTLRDAFRRIRGISPHRHLRAHRLTQARRALLSAEAGRGTVTQIAMRFGFLELGRFAVDYRSTFGERPSETLRRSLSVQLCKS